MRRRFAILGVIFAFTASACESLVVLGGVDDASTGDADAPDARADGLLSNDVAASDVQDDTTNRDAGPGGCFTNGDCVPDTDYCSTNAGTCGSAGTCETRPDFCIDGSVYDANFDGDTNFCTCDGVTVQSPCVAAQQGKDIDHAGSCP